MTHVTYHAFKQFGQAATIAIVAAAGPGFIGTFVVAVKRYNEEREVIFKKSMNDMVVGLRLTCLCGCFFSLAPHTPLLFPRPENRRTTAGWRRRSGRRSRSNGRRSRAPS